MTNAEMIELAAKAAGYVLTDGSEGYRTFRCYSGSEWSPRDDDGDCARMEAVVGLNVYWNDDSVHVGRFGGELSSEYFHPKHGDKYAARRLASLRAASVIGRAMP